MPDPSIMYYCALLLQVVAVIASKEPQFLSSIQARLQNNNWLVDNSWNLNEESSIRDLIRHQLIGHIRSMYEWLDFLRFAFFCLVGLAFISGLVMFFSTTVEFTQSTIYAFVFLFSLYAVLISFPAITCFLLAILIGKMDSLKTY